MTFIFFMRLFTGLAFSAALLLNANDAASAHDLTRAEQRICAHLKQCLDIMERHGPDEFDYSVLQDAILQFGPKGKAALFRNLTSNDETAQRRAQILLSKGGLTYGPQDQAQIAALWPRGDIHAHAKIMQANLSATVLSRAIETLSHSNAEIANLSREILEEAATRISMQRLSQMDYGRLAKSAIQSPTPGLIGLIKTAPAATSQPILTRILRSSDAPSVIAAYDALFEQYQKTAFQTLVGTLYNLKDTEAETAFALAALLRKRHQDRSDGFYLKFASDIANDPKMSAMGRLTGFDAVMGHTMPGHNRSDGPALPNSPLMIGNLSTALNNHRQLPLAYAENFYASAKANPKAWTSLIWEKLKTDPYKYPDTTTAFFNNIGKLPAPVTKDILDQAFQNKSDYGMLLLAIKTAAAQKDKSRLSQIEAFKNHPISDVRVYSASAVNALNKDVPLSQVKLNAEIKRANQSAQLCRARPQDFKKEAKQLPFFELTDVNLTAPGPRRYYLSTAAPTRSGWLVGFDAGEAGGGLQFYDNKSGKGRSILPPQNGIHNNVTALLPVTPQALGQYASEFWAIMSDGKPNGRAAIYRLSELASGYRLVRHAELPNSETQISQQKNGDVFISFFKDADRNYVPHAPLLLTPNGSLRRACEGGTNENVKALP